MPRISFLIIILLMFSSIAIFPQKNTEVGAENIASAEELSKDTLPKSVKDSMEIEDLKLQIQELKLNEILILAEYDRSLKQSAEADSLKKVRQKAQVDSLRSHTNGIPLVIENDTLFLLYTKRGGVSPRERVSRAQEMILRLGKSLTMEVDSLSIFESEYVTDIMCGEHVIITLTDQDGLWQNKSRQELAEEYLPIIEKRIQELHAEYGLMMKLKGILYSILVIVVQIVLIYLTNKLFRKVRRKIVGLMRTKMRPIKIKDYEFLDVSKQARVLLFFSNVVRLLVILIQLIISIPILFSIFPETKDIAYTLFSYVWDPFWDILKNIGRYLPNFIKIIVIFICFRYLNKGLKYVTNEIATGKLSINGFYADWAYPTYYIFRFLLYSFMVIMIWPLLPNSDSAIFQGVSVFVGLVISLGSTTVIGNLMAGMVLTYMRSFRIGDQIKMSDVMGVVIEKTPFVTRIRTRQNEIVTIPNSAVMSAQTINYSMSIEYQPIVVAVDVTVGYEVEKNLVRKLLVEAALGAKGIVAYPQPFVLIPKLDDFYCSYQVNAYTRDVKTLARVTSNLNESVMDKLHEAGIEILSPHYVAQRDGNQIMMPSSSKKQAPPHV